MALDQQDKVRLENETSEEPVALEEKGLPREVYALLAHANLLRMRGSWDAAVENCIAALDLSPNSSSAQSLLGDIYENQDRHDDAIQWYRMALDINPNSPADKMKLDRLLELQTKHPRHSQQTQSAVESSHVAFPEATPTSDKALRLAAVTAAILLLMIVVFAYVSIHRHTSLTALGISTDQEVKTPMVVLPPTNGLNPASSVVEGAHDMTEQTLLESLQASQVLTSQGISICNVEIDPRSSALEITMSVVPAMAAGFSRETILRAAFLTAQIASATASGQTATKITIRCLGTLTGAGGVTSLIFIGDLPRSSISSDIPGDTDTMDASKLQTKFISPWWSPQIPS